jgi:DNA-binding ferritin-like protein
MRGLRESMKSPDEACDDTGLADFLLAFIQAHDNTAWMLRCQLL